jgi:pSer/pThr/pTyr-binding forkhead associated (FHA) protein
MLKNARFALVVGSRKPRDIKVTKGRMTIGRSKSAGLTIDDPLIDDINAEIVGDETRGFKVNALGVSPLRVKGRRVRDTVTLAVGDTIELGSASLKLLAETVAASTAQTAEDAAAKPRLATRLKSLVSGTGAMVVGFWVVLGGLIALATSGTPEEKYRADSDDFKAFVVAKLGAPACQPVSSAGRDTAKDRFANLVREGVLAERRGTPRIAADKYAEALAIIGEPDCIPVRFARYRLDVAKAALPTQGRAL